MVPAGYFLLVIFSNYFTVKRGNLAYFSSFLNLLKSNLKKITNMQYPHGTILNSNSDSTHKKLPENIYFFGVPNILPEPDPGRLCILPTYSIFI